MVNGTFVTISTHMQPKPSLALVRGHTIVTVRSDMVETSNEGVGFQTATAPSMPPKLVGMTISEPGNAASKAIPAHCLIPSTSDTYPLLDVDSPGRLIL